MDLRGVNPGGYRERRERRSKWGGEKKRSSKQRIQVLITKHINFQRRKDFDQRRCGRRIVSVFRSRPYPLAGHGPAGLVSLAEYSPRPPSNLSAVVLTRTGSVRVSLRALVPSSFGSAELRRVLPIVLPQNHRS